MGLESGDGPLPPVKGVTPIPSMQSSAPNALGPRPQGQDAPSLESAFQQPQPTMQAMPQIGVGQLEAVEPLKPLGNYQGYHEDAFSAPYNEPPVVEHHSVEGFVKNLGDDVGGFVAGIPAAFKTAWNAGSQLTGNGRWVDDLYKHPEYLSKELQNTWTHVVQGFTDTYKDGVGEALYKHPFSVFMDATTIADIVGGGIKAAGKAAMTGLEREAMTAGARTGSIGEHIIQLGDRIQRFPGQALKAPFEAAGNLALKVPQIKTLAENFALTPLGLAEKDAMAAQILKGRVTAAQKMEDILERNLTTAQRNEYWQLRDGYLPLDTASDPALRERAELWQRANKDYEIWMTQMGIKSADELAAGSLKPLAERIYNDAVSRGEQVSPLFSDFDKRTMSKEWLDKAAQWRDGANPWGAPTQPSYHPFFAERTFDLGELLEAMKSQANTTQYVKRFEKKTGYGPGIVTNPDVVESRAMLQINELKAMVDYISDSTGRLGKPVKLGSEMPKGYVLMDPILKRYIENGLVNGVELLSKNFAAKLHEVLGGKSLFDALKESHAQTAKTLEEMGVWKDLKEAAANPEAWQVAIPKEVAYLIDSQLKGVTGPLRFYDKVLNTWRNVVLRLMPRFYINNLLGHSTLLMFGGHLPFLKSMARDEKLLPAESLSSMGIQADAGYRSDLISGLPGMKQITDFTEAVAKTTGSIPRQLLLNTKMQDILSREAAIGDAAAKAMLAGKSMEEAVNAAYAARKELQELGSKELIKAKELAGGDMDSMSRAIRGEKKQVFTPEQQRQLADIDKQLKEFDIQLKKEEALSNATQADPRTLSAPDIRKQGIKDAMASLVEQRDKLQPLGRADWVSSDMKHLSDLQEMSARREYLAPIAHKVEEAVRQMEQFLGNYGRMHPLESKIVRRIIPFWTFQKTMGKLLLQLPVVAPKVSFLWNQYAKLMIDAANDDRLPDRFRNAIPIGHSENPDGDLDTIFMKIDGFSPFRDTGMSSFGGVPIPKQIDPMQNPFIKLGVESMGGYDNFTEKPFTQPTDFVTLNGAVWRFNPERMELKQVVPQKPLIDSLFNQLPHMKIVREALDSFDSTRGAADLMGPGHVTPQNAEGSYLYNRHWWWAASRAMGFPVHVSNPEKVEMMHNNMVQNMIQRYYGEMHRVDPETQEKLTHILEDIGTGAWKLREWGD